MNAKPVNRPDASCHECGCWIEKRQAVFCSLCRHWLCEDCMRTWHTWNCPKNEE